MPKLQAESFDEVLETDMIRVGSRCSVAKKMLWFPDNDSDDLVFQAVEQLVEIIEEIRSTTGIGEKSIISAPSVHLDGVENDIGSTEVPLLELLNFRVKDLTNIRPLDDYTSQYKHWVIGVYAA